MNILIANTQEFNKKIGGVERISIDLAEELIKKGYNVYFLAAYKSTYKELYDVPSEQLILNGKDIYSLNNIKQFRNLLDEKKIDIVINQAGNIYNFSMLCVESCKNKAKLISKIHIAPKYMIDIVNNNCDSKINKKSRILRVCKLPLNILQRYRMKKLYSYVYNNSDTTVLLSEKFKEEFVKYSKVKENNKLKHIPNYTKFEVQRINKKENIILYVGRLEFYQKRPDRIIEIWENLYNEFPEWKLKIAGNGPEKELLESYVKRKGIKNIEFLGFCDINVEYKKSDIICMTSSFEGFGLVLIEASSKGCIPIAFDSFASIYDIIDDEVNGYIINSFSLKEYQTILRKLMGNDRLRAKIKNESYKINEKFDKSLILNKWENLFNDLEKEVNQ